MHKEHGFDPVPPKVERAARLTVDAALEVHRKLGPGLLESVCQLCLAHELRKRGLKAETEVDLPVVYDGIQLDATYRIDVLVEGCLVVELKAVEELTGLHKAQLLTYLRLTGHRLGLLINFNITLLKKGIKRLIL